MSVVQFAEEFTQLISRWTRSPVLNKNGADNLAPLTKQQLVKTVRDVMEVMLEVQLQGRPQTEITAAISNSPVASKIKLEPSSQLSGRFGSLDALTPSFDSLLASQSQEETEISKYNRIALLPDEKKFMSRSNPAIHVHFTDKPDASIREQAERGVLNTAMEQQEVKGKSRLLLCKIEILKKCAADIVMQIDELRKEMCPQRAKPIRQLPSISASPGLTGVSSLLRKAPPPNHRRSTIGFPGTSGTKKLNTTVTIEKEKASARRQTIAPGSIYIKPSKISPKGHSSSVAGSTTKKSPPATLKTTKNPKYAHVQSTIPKLAFTKKAQ